MRNRYAWITEIDEGTAKDNGRRKWKRRTTQAPNKTLSLVFAQLGMRFGRVPPDWTWEEKGNRSLVDGRDIWGQS